MKRKIAVMMSTVLAAGATVGMVPAAAQETGSATEEMMAYVQEASALPNYQLEETVTMEAEGVAMTMTVTGMKGENGISGVDLYAAFEVPELAVAYEVSLEDLVRVLPDACYLNTGEIFDTVSELMGNGIAERFVKMFGLTEDWIRIPCTSVDEGIPMEQIGKLVADVQTPMMECYSVVPVTEVENGWQMTMNNEVYLQMIDAMVFVMDENLALWVDDSLAVLKELNLDPMQLLENDYVTAAVEGIQEIDPLFNMDEISAAMTEELDLESMQAMLDSVNGAYVEEALKEEGVDFSMLSSQMKEELEREGMEINYTYTLTKGENGGYAILVDGVMGADGVESDVRTEASVTPIEAFAVEAPENCVELADLVRDVAATTYMLYYLGEGEFMESLDIDTMDDSYEIDESEEYVMETVTFDGNRFLMKDWYGTELAWITYDEQKLSLDTVNSAPQYAYLDFADGSDYISLSIMDYATFADYHETDITYYTEQFAVAEVSEIANTTSGSNTIQYYTVTFANEEDEEPCYMLVYGMDLGSNSAVIAEYAVYSPMTMADIHSLINSTFTSVELVAQ
ncbi:MAG: hypothetical protein IJ468_11685 [Lachnospiraceae bacterium]|nr:hypothetical protein [Lachnospiraceae bacterium]